MRVLIIGNGYVGGAVRVLLRHLDPMIHIATYDIDPARSDFDTPQSIPGGWDIAYICTPTPTVQGVCDADSVWAALENAHAGIVVIKSTIPPDVVEEIHAEFPYIVYEPEFLTQANAGNDIINAEFRIIGTTDNGNFQTLSTLYGGGTQTTPKAASAAKYSINTFLALKVAYMNELQKAFAGIEWDEIVRLISLDTRIGSSHMQVPGPDGQFGFGGACFPKDTEALLGYSADEMPILRTAVVTNHHVRN